MNKLPTKQIYLLVIIIMGIVSLSIYSTYAIFTYEGSTSDIVSIHTPDGLSIKEDIYEYREVVIPKDSYKTIDIDIYNINDYEICFNIWYKILDNDDSKIDIYYVNNDNIYTVLEGNNIRKNILIINDNDKDVVVNIGVNTSRNGDTCILDTDKDVKVIDKNIDSYKSLNDYIKNSTDKDKIYDEGYNTYKNINKEIVLDMDKIIISKDYSYSDEIFKIDNPIEIDIKDIDKYKSNDENNYYTCIEGLECSNLIKINNIEIKKDIIDNEEINTYKIINYDKMVGYVKGKAGIKNIDNNYIYYGDNPDNYIYYNCIDNECELFRIMGSYYDIDSNEYYTKIIKEETIGKYRYIREDLDYLDSEIYKYLDSEYKYSDRYSKEITYKQDYLRDNNININYFDIDIKSNIGIVSLWDYLKGSSCSYLDLLEYNEDCYKDNYLNFGDKYYTYTREYVELEDDISDKIYSVGTNIEVNDGDIELDVRPVIYLKSRMLLVDGNGTLEEPFMIK